MKRFTVLLTLFVLGANLVAQDVEPTLARAVVRISHRLARELPYRAAPADALMLRPEKGTRAAAIQALGQALLAEGFRIQADRAGADEARVLPLAISTRPAGEVVALRVATNDDPPFAIECAYGGAGWVDAAADGSLRRIVIAGPLAGTPERAVELARGQVEERLRAGFPALARRQPSNSFLNPRHLSSFIASEGAGDSRLFRAYVAAEPEIQRLERAERLAIGAEWIGPLVRLGLGGAAALTCWLLFLRSDFRSRGYRTGRLRIAFATLFAVLTAGIWRLPL